MYRVGSPLNSHPSWLVTRLSAALPLPSSLAITPDLEALYLNHITQLCVLRIPFEVTRVRHLSSLVWVDVPVRHILISWSDFLSVCVCFQHGEGVCLWGWGDRQPDGKIICRERRPKATLNSFIVTIMNLRENPCLFISYWGWMTQTSWNCQSQMAATEGFYSTWVLPAS